MSDTFPIHSGQKLFST